MNKPVGSKGLACPHAGATLDEVKLYRERSPSLQYQILSSFIAANGGLAPSARLGRQPRTGQSVVITVAGRWCRQCHSFINNCVEAILRNSILSEDSRMPIARARDRALGAFLQTAVKTQILLSVPEISSTCWGQVRGPLSRTCPSPGCTAMNVVGLVGSGLLCCASIDVDLCGAVPQTPGSACA